METVENYPKSRIPRRKGLGSSVAVGGSCPAQTNGRRQRNARSPVASRATGTPWAERPNHTDVIVPGLCDHLGSHFSQGVTMGTSSTITRPVTGRTLHLVDIENLVGDPARMRPWSSPPSRASSPPARWTTGDHVIVAANPGLMAKVAFDLPVPANVHCAPGRDGADGMLLARREPAHDRRPLRPPGDRQRRRHLRRARPGHDRRRPHGRGGVTPRRMLAPPAALRLLVPRAHAHRRRPGGLTWPGDRTLRPCPRVDPRAAARSSGA